MNFYLIQEQDIFNDIRFLFIKHALTFTHKCTLYQFFFCKTHPLVIFLDTVRQEQGHKYYGIGDPYKELYEIRCNRRQRFPIDRPNSLGNDL